MYIHNLQDTLYLMSFRQVVSCCWKKHGPDLWHIMYIYRLWKIYLCTIPMLLNTNERAWYYSWSDGLFFNDFSERKCLFAFTNFEFNHKKYVEMDLIFLETNLTLLTFNEICCQWVSIIKLVNLIFSSKKFVATIFSFCVKINFIPYTESVITSFSIALFALINGRLFWCTEHLQLDDDIPHHHQY